MAGIIFNFFYITFFVLERSLSVFVVEKNLDQKKWRRACKKKARPHSHTASCSWKFIKLFNNNECACVWVYVRILFDIWYSWKTTKIHRRCVSAAAECTSLPTIPFKGNTFVNIAKREGEYTIHIFQWEMNLTKAKNRSEIPKNGSITYGIWSLCMTVALFRFFAWMRKKL